MNNLNDFYKDIIDMNVFVGNDSTLKKIEDLYADLTLEESVEVFDGINEKSVSLVIDGLIDTLVTGSYLYYCKNAKPYLSEIDSNTNITKEKVSQSIDFLEKNYYKTLELKAKKEDEKLRKIYKDNVYDILKASEYILRYVDVDYLKCASEVSRSNWTKFPLSKDVNEDDEIERILNQGRYEDIYTVKKVFKNVERIIFFNKNGKFIKPTTFEEPNFEGMFKAKIEDFELKIEQ